MPRLHSFYLAPQAWVQNATGIQATLTGREARHLRLVLRHGLGETVRLFDGAGREGRFQVRRLGKDHVELTASSAASQPRPEGLVLALGFGKAGRRDFLLEKAVELGAAGLIFWQAERSQGRMPPAVKDAWHERLIQAAKQCRAVWLPELAVLPTGLDGLTDMARDFTVRLVAWEKQAGQGLLTPAQVTGRALVVMGPEGGLTPDEVRGLTAHGFQTVSLGRSVLRWETAALLCLGLAHAAREAATGRAAMAEEEA